MKKTFYFIFIFLFFIFIGGVQVSATSGTCIFKQQSKTHQIDTPFYWYSATKEVLYDNMLHSNETYSHTYELIKTSAQCTALNNTVPTYIQGINNNALSNRTINYYFDKNLLNDSAIIFNNSLNKFSVPDLVYTTGFEITTNYITFDELPPVIATDQINSTIVAQVNEKISIDSIKSKINAYDEVDGIIEIEIYEDNYTKNYNKLGTFTITFSATDNSSNTATLTISIKIVDTTKPIISGKQNITSHMSNPLTINQIKSSLSVTDNYDTNLSSAITPYSDNYSKNINKEGTFEIAFTAKDNSNNESLPFVVKVTMIDDIAPTINGETSYKTNVKTLLDTTTISEQLNAIDNIDQSPSIELQSNTYTQNYYKVGIYQLSFISKDKNNNISSPFTINIIVEDTEKPIFYVSKKFIGLDSTTQIPIEEIIQLINEANSIEPTNISSLTILEDNYTENFSKEGTYTIKLKYEYTNKEEIILESNIVVSTYKENTKNKNTPKKTFWSVIRNLIFKIWNFIKKIFIFFKELI